MSAEEELLKITDLEGQVKEYAGRYTILRDALVAAHRAFLDARSINTLTGCRVAGELFQGLERRARCLDEDGRTDDGMSKG